MDINNQNRLEENDKIVISLLGESLSSDIKENALVKPYYGAYELSTKTGKAFLFNYAVGIFWGVDKDERNELLQMITPYLNDPEPKLTMDSYSYTIDQNAVFNIKNDHMTIPDSSTLVRFALSHAFAQSAKLAFFEEKAGAVITLNLHIPKRLAKTGKSALRRKTLAQLRGALFDTSCDITLNFNLLDKPKFFWNYPELDDYYFTLMKYLEMTQRIDLLNHKLSMIHELLDMLAEEQHQKHSSSLEWIIIILIALEIVLYLFAK